MSLPNLLLSLNINNIDLVDYFINNVSNNLFINNGIITRTLTLTTTNGIDTCLGTVIFNNVTYSKLENQSFTNALVSDTTFITNLSFFLSTFSIPLLSTTIIINGTNYICKSYITISGKPYYVLNLV